MITDAQPLALLGFDHRGIIRGRADYLAGRGPVWAKWRCMSKDGQGGWAHTELDTREEAEEWLRAKGSVEIQPQGIKR